MIRTSIQLRFNDFDLGGHVHNAAYLHYFETARIGFFKTELGENWDWRKDGLILKKNTIEYHVPIFIEDQIQVEVECSHVGSKSFTLTYAVKNNKNQLMAQGASLVVTFDYTKQSTVEIPLNMRLALEKHLVVVK